MALHNRVYNRVQTQLNLGCHFLVHGFYCGYRISMDFPQHISCIRVQAHYLVSVSEITNEDKGSHKESATILLSLDQMKPISKTFISTQKYEQID